MSDSDRRHPRSARQATAAECAALVPAGTPVPSSSSESAVGGESSGSTAAHVPAGRRPGVVRRLVARTTGNAWDDDIFSESAAAAFWQTLSLPPLLLGLFGVLGYVGGLFGPDTVAAVQRAIVESIAGVFSRSALDQIIAPTIAQVLSTARGEVVSVGFVISLWSGSSAMSAFVDAITRAHGQYEVRNLVWQRALSVLMYLVGLLTGIVALPLVALGPERVLPLLPDSWLRTLGTVFDAVYYPLLVVILVVALTTLYKVALPLKPPWHRGLPGALLAALVFLLGSSGLRLYLDWLTNTGYTYGALAAPIAFLLATFFIGLAIILGAHLNAAIQEFWPVPLSDRRGRLARSGPGTAALRRAIRENPDAAAAVLEQLAYTVESPAGRRMARDRQEERVARDQQDGAGDHK